MRRFGLPVLGTGIGLVLVLGGCTAGCDFGSEKDPETPSTKTATAAPPPKPAFDGWPQPAAVIVLSGQQHGYLEPCGCSETQSGGLARRADLFRQLAEKGWPAVAFDLGGTVRRSSRQQSRIKFETNLAALRDMPYAGLALGPEEIELDPDVLVTSGVADSKFPECPLPFLGANVTFVGGLEELGPAAARVVRVGEVQVGVAAALDPAAKSAIAPEGTNLAEKFTISDPAPAVAAAVEQLESDGAEVTVLLAHMSRDKAKQSLAEQLPRFDVVLCTSGEEPPPPERVGGTLLVSVGHKGKHVGAIGVYPGDEKDRVRFELRFELVDLDSHRFQNAPKMHEHMRNYQDRLKAERIVVAEPAIAHSSGAQFVGAQQCGECHTKAYAKWKTTKHAQAFESLSRGREGQENDWIPRTFDAECISCHVTGWEPQESLRYHTGFVNEEFLDSAAEKAHSRLLQGQQCENCHGPGGRHVELEGLWRTDRARFQERAEMERLVAARGELKLNRNTAARTTCTKCHDLDNSPNFEFDKYWDEVQHPWKD
ncbi:MAG: multiheme c-type cytochrome [Planctomycetales bacterium]